MTTLVITAILIGVAVQIYRCNQDPVKREYKRERVLYIVEPLVNCCFAWERREDVKNPKEVFELDFNELDDVQFEAKIVTIGDEKYWKLYIIGDNGMRLVYVNSTVINPVEQIVK